MWDVQSGSQLKTLTLPGSRPAWSLTFSPDGRILAAGGPDNSISLLDLQSGSLIRQLHGHLDT
jgi:WD40 repeat protein